METANVTYIYLVSVVEYPTDVTDEYYNTYLKRMEDKIKRKVKIIRKCEL